MRRQLPAVYAPSTSQAKEDLRKLLTIIWYLILRILKQEVNAEFRFRRWHIIPAVIIFFLVFQFRVQSPPAVVQYVVTPQATFPQLMPELPVVQAPVEEATVTNKDLLPVELRTPKKEVRVSDAAPMVPKIKIDNAKVKAYVNRFLHVAKAEEKKYGIPMEIALAQGIIESRSGSSTLAVRANNHFGIKCFSKKCGPGHCINHADDHSKDFFRKYGNAWESWRAHSILLSSGRYKKLHKYGKDWRAWAEGLERVGYATDREYAEKLISVIETYRLYDL